ncbi:MAG TPA: hypothetical protein VJT69_19090 [Pyrinomonadaceae bacterium]|nr:hypothetical protein [Pyrinomonadaceae bacterium]
MSYTSELSYRRPILGFAMFVACILMVAYPGTANGQWTTNGNNINNTNSGNVGVGTSNPAQKLDVAGAIASSGTTVIDASRNVTNAGSGTFSGTVYSGALNSFVANSSNAVIVPPASPAIGFNSQRFDQYVSRSAIGGLFGTNVHPETSGHYSYGIWSRAVGNGAPAGGTAISETIGVLAESQATIAPYNAAVKANSLMIGDYYVNGSVFGIDASVGRAAWVTLTQGNQIYGVRSIASGGSNYGTGDTVYGIYASGSGGSLNYGVYSAAGTNYFSGKVGVGITSPSYSLDINGGINGFRAKASTSSAGDAVAAFENSGGIQMILRGDGKLGLGTASPSEKLHVQGGNVRVVDGSITIINGNINAKYQDVAEWVDSSQELPPGTVVVLDSSKSNQVIASTQSYDGRVAGVISLKPGLALGEEGEGRVLVATTGRVKVKVDASSGPIQIGDLLVTSDKPGLAMKSMPVDISGVRIHRPGTLIGKALEPLAQGTGEILVLLSMQ